MRAKLPKLEETIYYPESDGKPMAETETHLELMLDLIHTLRMFFLTDPLVHVGGNLLMYYIEGNPRKSVAPDVFFVRGMDKAKRDTYLVWKEGRAPDVIMELTSKSTWREDLQKKWRLYAQLGVKEYYLYDPLREYPDEPLTAYKLDEEGEYQTVTTREGRVRSEALGLELVDTGETLRLYDPAGQQFLPTAREEADRRQRAEEARQRAEAERQAEAETRRHVEAQLQGEIEARQRAEAEAERLRRELGRSKG